MAVISVTDCCLVPPPPDAPSLTQVWDFSASADARDTEGGASKRSLLEQVEKMRAYLAAEQQH